MFFWENNSKLILFIDSNAEDSIVNICNIVDMIISYLLLGGMSFLYFIAIYRVEACINTMKMVSSTKAMSYNYVDTLLNSTKTQLHHA